jgi:hypothetical protein
MIDGVDIGGVKNNSVEEFDVADGQHEVWVAMDWCKSQSLSVSISEGQVVTLVVIMPGLLGIFLRVLFTPEAVFGLKQE